MFDPAYSELLDTNQELRGELQDEIFINKSNEKKIRSLDKKFKDEVGSIQDGQIIELENKVGSLKARIRILIDKKISINALDMATTNLIANVNRGLDRIENHIRGVGTPMQNPANVIDGIRGSLNTIRVTLQNITAERDQYQNILNDTNNRERDLGNQLRDSRNQNLRFQRLLDKSRVRVERTVRERDNAQGERDLAMLAYKIERQESCRWMFSYRDKDRRVQGLLREKFAKQLLYQRDTNLPANDPYTNGTPAINTPAIFTVWLRHKYREVMAGNAELALQSLIQERFNQGDSPDVYESRIRKHIVGFADDQVLPALYTHLPLDLRNSGKIYMAIRGAGHQTVDNFFADLRKCWVERQVGPNMFSQNQIQPQVSYQGATSADFEKLNTKIASLEAQLAESMQVHSKLAQRLHLPENVINSNNAPIYDKYINEELERRLGVIETHLAELLRKDTVDTNSTLNDHSNEGLEKRLGQIEAHLTKLAKKDSRDAKTFQRRRSESSPFGGFEKRLGQIEALLAKLARGSKSKSGRVHMVTADEQSSADFFDNDTTSPSKPEDNDDDSDNSSTESDSEKRDTNIYITYGKKK
ncbi:unnamed protein product [Rhizophagus irregularis]|uniref:Uncharacterized protein n=1 Tax=Rhizophagus irregularis TaxID=588596 RepID=A0A916A0P6_9GLOM|nr:unnamed protein product [Rhizophagus irregularis]